MGREDPSVCKCQESFVAILKELHPLYNQCYRLDTQLPGSLLPALLRPAKRPFTTFWMGLWSVLCFISISTTVVTLLIHMECFCYPERLITFLPAFYFLVLLVMGPASVSCN